MRQIKALLVTAVQLKHATSYDPVLSKVLLYTKQGWPDKVDKPLKPSQEIAIKTSDPINCTYRYVWLLITVQVRLTDLSIIPYRGTQ